MEELGAKINLPHPCILLSFQSSAMTDHATWLAHLSSCKVFSQTTHCKCFLCQCSLYFSIQENIPGEQRIAQFINLLRGKVHKWATAIWEQGRHPFSSYDQFIELFQRVFEHVLKGKKYQGTASLCDLGKTEHSWVCTGVQDTYSRWWVKWTCTENGIPSSSQC